MTTPTRAELTALLSLVLEHLSPSAAKSYRAGIELYLRSPYPLTRDGLLDYTAWLYTFGFAPRTIILRLAQVRRLSAQAARACLLAPADAQEIDQLRYDRATDLEIQTSTSKIIRKIINKRAHARAQAGLEIS